VTPWEIFHILDHLHSTDIGLDNVPAWCLRLGAPVFAEPVATMFNHSLATATVLSQWKRSSIFPLLKVPPPTALSDFRSISITSVLSRIIEQIMVRRYIYPAIIHPPPPLSFVDQHVFRPLTAGVISLLGAVTKLLDTNQYVHVYALDFNAVRHFTLMEKMAALSIPDNVYNWMVSFFADHSHCTKLQGETWSFETIDASVIQSSALGLAAFLINAADLRTVHKNNIMVKFADDACLIVGSTNEITRADELRYVETWAASNNLKLNTSKSVEIVFENLAKTKRTSMDFLSSASARYIASRQPQLAGSHYFEKSQRAFSRRLTSA